MNQQGQKEDKPKQQGAGSYHLFDYFKHHMREAIAFVLLILGILLMFFEPLYGGVIVGIVAGIYFSDEITQYIKGWQHVECFKGCSYEQAKHIVGLGTLVTVFIVAPALYLGAAVAVGIKLLFSGQIK